MHDDEKGMFEVCPVDDVRPFMDDYNEPDEYEKDSRWSECVECGRYSYPEDLCDECFNKSGGFG